MAVNILAKSLSGKYGADKEIGDIIHVEVDIGSGDPSSTNKEIVFLIDISGSMEVSIKNVKSSLLAFRDSIVGKSHLEMETLEPIERDMLLRNTIRIRIITFSNTAKEAWSNESEGTFENAVVGLNVESMTNMGDAIKMAFDKVDRTVFTWIIAMTDGESNKGPCQTSEAFQRLVTTSKPLNCKIVSLGYGKRFDPEVLNVIGTFVYVQDTEMIPVVLGNLASEIMTSVGFNCVIDIPGTQLGSELTDDTIIVPAGEGDTIPGRIIAGKRVMGSLCHGKKYHYVYLPYGRNCSRTQLEKYNRITVRYADILTGEIIEKECHINHTYEIPSDPIRDMVFEYKKKTLIQRLYKVLQTRVNDHNAIKKEVNMIRTAVEKWGDDEVASPHREEILRMLRDVGTGRGNTHKTNTVLNYTVCSGYDNNTNDNDDDNDNNNSDNNNNRYLGSTLAATNYYLASPLVNNN